MPNSKFIAASAHAKSVDMSGSFGSSKRNLLDKRVLRRAWTATV
jgi:hypothetical protein